ncbi:hypothetical protein ACNOYE_04210 [Nannocystaceae bacterium ST9]
MTDARAKARAFYNAIDFDRPINFGQDELVGEGPSDDVYVASLHGGDGSPDPIVELANQIDLASSAGAYLFTGNRGTGKTTELMRLAKQLRAFGCEVFYVDMAEYLLLTQRIEITDFLISMLGALSEKVSARFGQSVGQADFFARVWSFLQSEVKFDEVSLPAGPLELKAALVHTPSFKEQLQNRTRGHVQTLVKQAREFVLEVVNLVRARRADPDQKVVLIVDSVERLRGVGDSKDISEIFKSVETLFGSHADLLRFTGLSVVYTIPPYLQALAGGLGARYAGGRIYALPSVHVYECCPEPGEWPKPSDSGLSKLITIIERRFAGYVEFFTREQLWRLAQSSGGDLRDYFRMLKLAVTRAVSVGLPLGDGAIKDAEDAVRSDMLPIARDDREWLEKIGKSHKAELDSLERLPNFARLQEGKYVLQYRNGEEWFALHPLLRKELGFG